MRSIRMMGALALVAGLGAASASAAVSAGLSGLSSEPRTDRVRPRKSGTFKQKMRKQIARNANKARR